MFRWIGYIWVWFIAQIIRAGWYQQRKAEGYPITLRRAFFSQYPRFGAYEEHEAGCPESDKEYYNIVKD
jgi:hypothetical protein